MYTAVPIPCSMAGTSKTSLFSAANSSSAKGQYCCLSSCRLMNLANTGGKRPNSPHRGQASKAAVPPRRVTPSAAAEGHRGDVSVQERAATTPAMSLFFSPENKVYGLESRIYTDPPVSLQPYWKPTDRRYRRGAAWGGWTRAPRRPPGTPGAAGEAARSPRDTPRATLR